MNNLDSTQEFNDTGVSNTNESTTTENVMSEEEALSYLDSFNEDVEANNSVQEQEVQEEDTNQTQIEVSNNELSIPNVDMSMFNIVNEQPLQEEQIQEQQAVSNSEQVLQQILQKLEAKQEQKEDPSNAPLLDELAKRVQEMGVGLSEQDKELLSEVKAIKQEIEQQKFFEQQKLEFTAKINQVDEFNKELEKSIPNYNTDFMISLVKKISDENPNAGKQILDNPAMLISLWNKYGAVAVPQKPKTNAVLNSSSKPNNIQHQKELFDRVKSGVASEEEELRLISML